MKILSLEVEGFRSLKHVSWQPQNLNVVIGPNGTGKSNLLRVLELISLSAQGRLARYVQESGGMDPLVWDGISDHIFFQLKTSPPEEGRDEVRDKLTYRVDISRLGLTSAYRIGSELLANFHRVETLEMKEPFKFIERHGLTARLFDENQRALKAPEEEVPEEETLLSMVTPFAVTADRKIGTANRNISAFQRQLASWSVFHDLHVDQDAAIRQPAMVRPDKRVAPDGQNLISVLNTLYTSDRYFKKDIDAAMRAAFSEDFDELTFPPASDGRIQLRVRWRPLKREQSAADLSDGTLRFLFLMTTLASPSPSPLIAIDEPETGLHPSMLPIIAEYAVDAAQRTQVVLTTHSPQLLDAFGDKRPFITVASWENGETILKTLDEDRLGYWLKEYSLGSLFRSGELESMG